MDTVAFEYNVLDKIKKVPAIIKMLENGGHYPVEEKALDQMHEYIWNLLNKF